MWKSGLKISRDMSNYNDSFFIFFKCKLENNLHHQVTLTDLSNHSGFSSLAKLFLYQE